MAIESFKIDKACNQLLSRLQATFGGGTAMVACYERYINILIYRVTGRDQVIASYGNGVRDKGDMAQAALDVQNEKLMAVVTELTRYIGDQIAERKRYDFIGEIYEQIGSSASKAGQGQFFTPIEVGTFLALLVEGNDETKGIEEAITIADPCCGSGRLPILGAMQFKNKGKRVALYAGDIDLISCKMAAISCYLNGIPAIIEQRDGLAAAHLERTTTYFEVGIDHNRNAGAPMPYMNMITNSIEQEEMQLDLMQKVSTSHSDRGIIYLLHVIECKHYFSCNPYTMRGARAYYYSVEMGKHLIETMVRDLKDIIAENEQIRRERNKIVIQASSTEPIAEMPAELAAYVAAVNEKIEAKEQQVKADQPISTLFDIADVTINTNTTTKQKTIGRNKPNPSSNQISLF
jgi:microcompartment protein CcmL/EutN